MHNAEEIRSLRKQLARVTAEARRKEARKDLQQAQEASKTNKAIRDTQVRGWVCVCVCVTMSVRTCI